MKKIIVEKREKNYSSIGGIRHCVSSWGWKRHYEVVLSPRFLCLEHFSTNQITEQDLFFLSLSLRVCSVVPPTPIRVYDLFLQMLNLPSPFFTRESAPFSNFIFFFTLYFFQMQHPSWVAWLCIFSDTQLLDNRTNYYF